MIAPETEAELAGAIRAAKGPLCIRGGGTRPVGGAVDGEVLDMSAMSGITLYDPGALTMVAKAGTPLSEVEAALAAEGQMLAFEPMDHRALLATGGRPTIGGVVAGNVSGPRRVRAGACRDFMLGVRFVDGRGGIIKNGGRVMKNVTGYDLVRLMTGSRGTLGVLTEVAFKVLPKPETAATLVWYGLGRAAALKVFCKALGSPFEVSGAARLPQGAGKAAAAAAATVIRLEGFGNSVQYRVGRLRELFAERPPDEVVTDGAENRQIWVHVRDVDAFAGRHGNVWKSSVKPMDMIPFTSCSEFEHVLDLGGGLIWTLAPGDVDLRARNASLAGHHTLVRGHGFAAFQPESGALGRISAGLRTQFDPRGILNPRLMG